MMRYLDKVLNRITESTYIFLLENQRIGNYKMPKIWQEYDLSIILTDFVDNVPSFITKIDQVPLMSKYINPIVKKSIKAHWLVVHYLDTHPEIIKLYNKNQTGEIKYFDVLDLAEKESKINIR